MPEHWLLLRLSGHASHPVSHSDQLTLRSYLDERPGDDSDLQKQGDEFVVPTERAKIITDKRNERLWLQITAAEYNAGAYDLYLWIEPYMAGALTSSEIPNGLLVGRLKLGRGTERYRGVASRAGQLSASVDPKDLVITHDITLGDSVVQFIVNEMNTNAQNPTVVRTGQAVRNAEEYVQDTLNSNWFVRALTLENAINNQAVQTAAAAYTLGHLTHKNEGASGFFQDIVFIGGGQWDHKPILRPVWGEFNRLGNRHAVYYYDGWSNIHFGFIAGRMGVSLETAMIGAGKEQLIDNLGGGAQNTNATGDDEADTQAIAAGHRLGLRSATVTRQDVQNILNAHPGWIGRK